MHAKDIKKIYDTLQDNCSRELFSLRISHLLDGRIENLYKMWDIANLYSPYEFFDSQLNKLNIKEFGLNNKDILLYSNENTVEFCIKALKCLGIDINIFCNVSRVENGLFNAKCITSVELIEEYKEYIILIYSNDSFHIQEIMGHFRYHGFNSEQLIIIRQAPEEQYFGLEFLRPVQDEIYIDAGCFDGDTVLKFYKFCNGNYKHIYAIEPDRVNFKKAIEAINREQIERVEIQCKACWSKSDILSFSGAGTSSSHIEEGVNDYIQTITIDELLNGTRVTFIKMDIEGAELDALKGAEITIKKYRPRLAICLYHKPEDIIDIPAYLLSVIPDYKLYIRHHNFTDFCETVLYAI